MDGWVGVVIAIVARPRLWATAVLQGVRLVPRGWWREGSRLPRPSPAYVRFRTLTATGDPDRPPEPAEVVTWLEWCRAWRRSGL